MSVENLQDLFLHELKDVLDAERQITKALPKMVKGTDSEELKAAFEEHLR
jgi:ferritin-like metal-binding protein YciE